MSKFLALARRYIYINLNPCGFKRFINKPSRPLLKDCYYLSTGLALSHEEF